jgi:hypothetical protein
MFVLFGAVTLLWVVPWLMRARNLPSFRVEGREPMVPIGEVASKWPVWAMGIGHFGATYPLYFVLTWLPLLSTRTMVLSGP